MARILIVESDSGTLETLIELLPRFLGHTPELKGLTTAESALRALQEPSSSFDLVIIGNWLTQQDGGVLLISQIKSLFPQMPVILMSGLDEPVNHQANAFIKKPFMVREVAEIIDQLLPAPQEV